MAHLPSELRFEASDTSLATLSSLKLPGIRLSRVPDSEYSLVAGPCSEALVPQRFLVRGECVADLCLLMVEKRLTNEVLCLKLNELWISQYDSKWARTHLRWRAWQGHLVDLPGCHRH